MIIGIVAIANNFAIGKDGKLPWHYPADLKHFKATTDRPGARDGNEHVAFPWETLPNR
jgi:hypothetical protein